ncbi:MAG: DNA cytosine methyltransferase [Candidatus Omnitrophica bacterium]|nr:DNA cytosine methyltransferase [Candidatus Omnitrophota bacterium]
MTKHKAQYTVGSLFAGIGGICLGFQKAGFETVWANDFDKKAGVTYKTNFKHSFIEGDIHKVDPEQLEKVDIITSGFPCQAFSIAGYRKGFRDERGDLFFETIRFIDVIKPKAFLLENVKNLTTHDNGNTFKVIKDYILNSGYSFIPKVLNSKDYGNVPQNRERIYVVGFRGEDSFNSLGELSGSVCSNNFKFPDAIPSTRSWVDILDSDVDEKKYSYSKYRDINPSMFNMLSKFMVNEGSVYQWRRMYVRENKSNVCPTLTANMGTGGHNVPLIRYSNDIRKLTPRECARLQGFPDSFILPGNVATSQLYKQIGNSVTVPVIERIAERIKIALNAKYAPETAKTKTEFATARY